MANKHEGSNALAGAQEEGPEYVDVEAFGHQLSLLRGLAENLITLEKEGAIYTHFWHEPSQTFRYYRIQFLPREIFEYVEAHVAKKQFDDAIENGATLDEAVEAIKDTRIRQRVVSYGNFGQCKTKDGTVLDIRGCAASFYPPEIEALVCGQRQDRYELLPRLDAVNATSLLIRIIDNFRVSIRALTDRSHNRPDLRIEGEYDVQDVLFACVRASFNDARREEWAPQHAGSAKRIDIAIPSAGALVEVKFVRTAQHAKTIADELKIDIESYHTHPTCGTLLVLVYDPRTYIADPEAIEQDLSGRRTKKTSSFDVQVMVRR